MFLIYYIYNSKVNSDRRKMIMTNKNEINNINKK